MVKFSVLIFVFLLLSVITLNAQSANSTNYYVVIGEFKKLDDAQNLTDEANLKTFNAHFMQDRKSQQYYVYLLQTSDQKKAKSFMKRIRKETEYKRARLHKENQGTVQ
jgi:cell division septation protein DedD